MAKIEDILWPSGHTVDERERDRAFVREQSEPLSPFWLFSFYNDRKMKELPIYENIKMNLTVQLTRPWPPKKPTRHLVIDITKRQLRSRCQLSLFRMTFNE